MTRGRIPNFTKSKISYISLVTLTVCFMLGCKSRNGDSSEVKDLPALDSATTRSDLDLTSITGKVKITREGKDYTLGFSIKVNPMSTDLDSGTAKIAFTSASALPEKLRWIVNVGDIALQNAHQPYGCNKFCGTFTTQSPAALTEMSTALPFDILVTVHRDLSEIFISLNDLSTGDFVEADMSSVAWIP